jgi:hypothetical protein
VQGPTVFPGKLLVLGDFNADGRALSNGLLLLAMQQ